MIPNVASIADAVPAFTRKTSVASKIYYCPANTSNVVLAGMLTVSRT